MTAEEEYWFQTAQGAIAADGWKPPTRTPTDYSSDDEPAMPSQSSDVTKPGRDSILTTHVLSMDGGNDGGDGDGGGGGGGDKDRYQLIQKEKITDKGEYWFCIAQEAISTDAWKPPSHTSSDYSSDKPALTRQSSKVASTDNATGTTQSTDAEIQKIVYYSTPV